MRCSLATRLSLAGLFVVALSALCAGGAGRLLPSSAAAPPSGGLRYEGVASCSSTACHGGTGPVGREYTVWVTNDPHGEAYNRLFDRRSLAIEAKLKGLKDLSAAQPHKDALCLGCHATGTQGGGHGDQFSLDDGVSCEACHGAAEKWRDRHFRPEWKQLSPADQAALGFRPTKELLARIRICTDCHVGTPELNVNHDLIAAGHPRLRFEFGAYQARLPKHWDERADKARYPDLEARSWALGQVVAAQSALTLLRSRCEGASKPWPEFAEYYCYSCHHGLQGPGGQPRRAQAGREVGTPEWGTWYVPMVEFLARQDGDAEAGKLLRSVAQAMEPRRPNPKQVADRARLAQERLTEWQARLATTRFDPPTTRRLLSGLLRDERKSGDLNWDTAAQIYLGAAALDQGLRDTDSAYRQRAGRAPLQEMVRQLAFPLGLDSPSDFSPARFARPVQEMKKLLDGD